MYNAHRGMVTHQAPSSRLTDLLEQIRAEFDGQAGRAGDFEQQRELLMSNQMTELDLIRRKIHELEQQHLNMKRDYETQVERLQRELDMRSGAHTSVHGGQTQPQPPSIGHGPRDLFGQIMAGGAQSASQLAPPPQDPSQPQGLPPHLTQAAALNAGPQPQSHAHFGSYAQPAPTLNGYSQAPPPATSPGPGKPRPRGPLGAATPQPGPPASYPAGSPRSQMPTPPLGHRAPPMQLQHQMPNVGTALADLHLDDLPQQFKKTGDEWWAVFNPNLSRRLDVDLVHTLAHESVVCCVRFSSDGRYVATGCNKSAQIYNVDTGMKVAHLEDETADQAGDLYIRSVCFSPDGRFLATGAEDKIIRVWDIAAKEIRMQFTGHEQDIYSLDFSRNGRMIASGSGDRTVRLWDLDIQKETMMLEIEDGVTTVALSPDGRLVAAGSLDRSVRVWDTETAVPVDKLEGPTGHKDSVYSVAFSPNSRELVSGSLDRTIKMWELTPPPPQKPGQPAAAAAPAPPKGTGKCMRTFVGHNDFVLSVALTPDGAWVLSGSKDRGVQFWDPVTGEAQLHLQGHRNSVISVAPSPKGGLFATGSGDTRARIWSYETIRG